MTRFETARYKAYPHASAGRVEEFSSGQGWYGTVATPEVGDVYVFASKSFGRNGRPRTSYRFTRDGFDYSMIERYYRRTPRGAAIVARKWVTEVLAGPPAPAMYGARV